MHLFNSIDEINSKHADSFISEMAITKYKQVIQRWPQHFDHHRIEISLTSIVVNVSKSIYSKFKSLKIYAVPALFCIRKPHTIIMDYHD
jgi:hypothetical protein